MRKTLIFFNLVFGLFANSNALYQIQQQFVEQTINSLLTKQLNTKFGKVQPTPPTTTVMAKKTKVLEINSQLQEAILMPSYGQFEKCRVKEWTRLKKLLHLMKLNRLIRLF